MKRNSIRYPQTARSSTRQLHFLSSIRRQIAENQLPAIIMKATNRKYSPYLRDTNSTEDQDLFIKNQSKGTRNLDKQQNNLSAELQQRQKKLVMLSTNQKWQKYQSNRRKIRITDFQIIRFLGKGINGKTCVGRHKASNFLCAIKIISKTKIKSDEKALNQMIRQLKIHSFLSHPNIVDLYGFFDDQNNVYLIEQLGSSGSLYQLIKKKKNQQEAKSFQRQINLMTLKQQNNYRDPFDSYGHNYSGLMFRQETIAILVRELLLAVSYMHGNKIIHRDLKPQNIVVIHGTVKICDIGLAVYCNQVQSDTKNTIGQLQKYYEKKTLKGMRQTICGTPIYLPPQIVSGVPYDQKVDIWVLGAIAYELLTGEDPFQIRRLEDLQKILSIKIDVRVGSNQFRQFVRKALNKDQTARFSAKQLIQGRFIRKYMELQTAQELCDQKQKENPQLKRRTHKRSRTNWQYLNRNIQVAVGFP